MSDPDISGYDWDLPGEDPTQTAGTAQVPPSSLPELRTLLSLAVAAMVIAALYLAKRVLISVTLAIMLSFVLTPLVNLLRRLRLGRTPSVILSVLLALGIIVGLGAVIASQAAVLASEAPRYASSIERKAEGARVLLTRRLTSVSGLFRVPRTAAEHSDAPESGNSAPEATPLAPVLVELAPTQSSAVGVVRSVLEPVLAPLETTVIVIVLVGFILLQKEDLRDRFIRLFGTVDLHRTTVAMDDAARRLSRYYLSQLGVNSAFGAVVTVGLWAIGVPSSALWGVIAGLARFVPYLGAFIAAAGPFLMAAAIEPGWTKALYVGVLFGIVEPMTAYAIEPFIYGHSTGLAPVSVVVAAVFWTWIWGPIGLILSTPLTLCLVVMGRHVKSLEFFDVLLGDRPALSPVQNFYQRILAGNPGEALDKAEAILADRSLLSYYDEVVVGGMRLAAEDEARGTLSRERVVALTRSILAVIRNLDDRAGDSGRSREDGSSPAAQATAVVGCVAGRNPFDEAVAAMLLQLLAQRGIPARRIGASALLQDSNIQPDPGSISVVVLCYLTPADTRPHPQQLIRRLRQRVPGAAVVLGLWPDGDPILRDSARQRPAGADRLVTSLDAAITATVELVERRSAPTPLAEPSPLVSTAARAVSG